MNYEDLHAYHASIVRTLNSKTAKKLVSQHPDADWSCGRSWHNNKYVIAMEGQVYLGYVDRKECDLLNCATSCDEEDLHVTVTQVEIVKGDSVYRVTVHAWQKMKPAEIKILKDIGKIVKVKDDPVKRRTRNVLMCGV